MKHKILPPSKATNAWRNIPFRFASVKKSFFQECLEEKKRSKDQLFNGNLSQVIDGLRDQLNSQKETMKKYEGKIKKRDAEVSQGNLMQGEG